MRSEVAAGYSEETIGLDLCRSRLSAYIERAIDTAEMIGMPGAAVKRTAIPFYIQGRLCDDPCAAFD